MRVLVLDTRKQVLMPCCQKRAQELLKKRRAAVYRLKPFTIILKYAPTFRAVQPLELKLDPGSSITGAALVFHGKRGKKIIRASHIEHRKLDITLSLISRRALRRSRRHRKTRYRKPRFNNRRRPEGWLPPSLRSLIQNILIYVQRLLVLAPISSLAVEVVKFDTQKLANPEITGVEYQQGTLLGYEVREYTLVKCNYTCSYCDAKNVPLEIDHITPRSKGGSNSITNLTLSCRPCNVKKGNQSIKDFLAHDPQRCKRIMQSSKNTWQGAAAVNIIRYALVEKLKHFNLPLSTGTGAQTKFNRTQQGYAKDHWIDAMCVGDSGADVYTPLTMHVETVKATGRGTRQMCRVDKYGFPRTGSKKNKQVHGFMTGDTVKARVSSGKKKGAYAGRVAVRSSGSFNITTKKGTVQGISYKHCKLLHRADGYTYFTHERKAFPPPAKSSGSPRLKTR